MIKMLIPVPVTVMHIHRSINQSLIIVKNIFLFFVKGEQAKYVMEIKPTWSSIVGELFFKTSFIVKLSNKKNLKRRGILK